MYKNGLVLGKFTHFHKGHELMIDFAQRICINASVLVSDREGSYPHVCTRADWIRKTFPKIREVAVLYETVDTPTFDENGVGIEDWFWNYWKEQIKSYFGDIDAVFTNDPYGERLAKELDADWVPIDTKREVFNISSTAIKNNLEIAWNNLNKYAKKYYQKRIAIIGPESSGKTTLVNCLSGIYDTVPEYGRLLSTIRNNKLNEQDFLSIVYGQHTLVDAIDSPVLVSDTEGITTRVLADFYLDKITDSFDKHLEYLVSKEDFDLYILLYPSTNWEDDGTRILPNFDSRLDVFTRLKTKLIKMNKNFVVIKAQDLEKRLDETIKHIEEL